MKKYLTTFLFLALFLFCGYLYFTKSENKEEIKNVIGITNEVVKKEPISLCYIYMKKTERDFYDKSWLRLDLNGENVSGEFRYLPAEKDSKVGIFEGTVSALVPEKMGRVANVWWNAQAEGMTTKEELILEFGEGTAVAGFGEMIDRGDGVYLYKEKKNFSYGPILGQVSCEDIDEMIAIEKYIKENIKTIATNKPVLGGSWYVLSVGVNTLLKEGEVIYEDGHVVSKASFIYLFNIETKEIIVKDFKVK